jgi:hypothetical protein
MSVDHLDSFRAAIRQMLEALDGSTPSSWDGPMDRSGTLVVEMRDGLELSVTTIASSYVIGLWSIPHDGTASRNYGAIKEERVAVGSFAPRSPEEAVSWVRDLLEEYAAMLRDEPMHMTVRDFSSVAGDAPESLAAHGREAAETAMCAAGLAGYQEMSGCIDVMIRITHPNPHVEGRIEMSPGDDRDYVLDEDTQRAILKPLDHLSVLHADGWNPPLLRVSEFTWFPVTMETVDDPMATLSMMSKIPAQPKLAAVRDPTFPSK